MIQSSSKWTVPVLRNHIRALVNMTSERHTLFLVYRILKSGASMQKQIAEFMERQTTI